MRIGVISDTPLGSGVRFASGFSNRYDLIVRVLAEAGHDLLVIPELPASGPTNLETEVSHEAGTTRIHLGRGTYHWPEGRLRRKLKGIARIYWMNAGRTGWEQAASSALRDWSPDVVLALAPWQPILSDLAPPHVPVALFAEEDFTPLRDLKQRAEPRPRWKERLRIALRPAPQVVVTISPTENAWAAHQYPRSEIHTVPHAVDLTFWSPIDLEPDPSSPDILCAGNFAHPRNAEGLDRVAASLNPSRDRPLTLGIASALPPPDNLLNNHHALVRYLGAIDDLRPLYAGSTLTLVPAFTVTGVKTQILQAWAMGCPVVTTEAGARSVEGKDGVDLVTGRSPDEVASRIEAVVNDPDLVRSLAAEGLERVRRDFSERTAAAALDQVLSALTNARRSRSRGHRRLRRRAAVASR